MLLCIALFVVLKWCPNLQNQLIRRYEKIQAKMGKPFIILAFSRFNKHLQEVIRRFSSIKSIKNILLVKPPDQFQKEHKALKHLSFSLLNSHSHLRLQKRLYPPYRVFKGFGGFCQGCPLSFTVTGPYSTAFICFPSSHEYRFSNTMSALCSRDSAEANPM